MSTKVQILDILKAFHRWDPNDVKDLFVNEIISDLIKDEDNRLLVSQNQSNSIQNKNIALILQKICIVKDHKIKAQQNKIQFIRQTNKRLYDEGKQLMFDMKIKMNDLEKQLSETRAQLKQSREQSSLLAQTNANLEIEINFINNKMKQMQSSNAMTNSNISNQQIESKSREKTDDYYANPMESV